MENKETVASVPSETETIRALTLVKQDGGRLRCVCRVEEEDRRVKLHAYSHGHDEAVTAAICTAQALQMFDLKGDEDIIIRTDSREFVKNESEERISDILIFGAGKKSGGNNLGTIRVDLIPTPRIGGKVETFEQLDEECSLQRKEKGAR